MDSVAPEGWLQMVGAVSQSAGGVETRHDRSRGGGKLSPGCRRLPPLGRPPCPLLLASPAGPIDYWEGWDERVRLKLIKPIIVHGCQAISNDACIGGGIEVLGWCPRTTQFVQLIRVLPGGHRIISAGAPTQPEILI